jgi:enoyl-CoA hydratase
MSDPVLVERPHEAVVLLRLNRPEARNALNNEVRRLLNRTFLEVSGDESVRCVVVTGNEQAFGAGADLKEMVSMGTADITRSGVRRLWKAMADCPQPVIAAVNGVALGGGCELAMHADIIIAGESARFGQPEVRVGIMPGGGATQRLVRAVGKFHAMRLLLTGDLITAAEARAIGLASQVVPDTEVESTALDMAVKIAAMPPLAIRRIKEVVLAGENAPLETGLMLERRAFDTLFDTEDQKEGMQAFIEKRQPRFKGR